MACSPSSFSPAPPASSCTHSHSQSLSHVSSSTHTKSSPVQQSIQKFSSVRHPNSLLLCLDHSPPLLHLDPLSIPCPSDISPAPPPPSKQQPYPRLFYARSSHRIISVMTSDVSPAPLLHQNSNPAGISPVHTVQKTVGWFDLIRLYSFIWVAALQPNNAYQLQMSTNFRYHHKGLHIGLQTLPTNTFSTFYMYQHPWRAV